MAVLEVGDIPLSLVDGSLVVRKDTVDPSGMRMVYQVIIDSDADFLSYPHTTSVKLKDKDNTIIYSHVDDLETVTDEIKELPESKSPDFSLEEGRTLKDVYKDIENLFAQMYQYYETQNIGKSIELLITAEGYSGDKNLEIKHTCRVGYDNNVTTNELDKSVKLATSRYIENEANKPKELALK